LKLPGAKWRLIVILAYCVVIWCALIAIWYASAP